MAVGAENSWWFDVLRQGQASPYASWFDIDWEAQDPSLRGKVLLPTLGKPLVDALRDGEITITDGDTRVARYFQSRFPIAGDVARKRSRYDTLTDSTTGSRRGVPRMIGDELAPFFDINELVGVRMENADAFEAIHELIFRLYGEGVVDGVRVDHVDGLADPGSYCRKLRRRLEALAGRRPPGVSRNRPYIIVEKILPGDEPLPASWQTDGTSGYDFMNEVSALQHDAAGEKTLNRLWSSVSGRDADFQTEEEMARREILARSFSAQLEACASSFHSVAREQAEEIPRAALRRALIELLAHFPVYRTYAASSDAADRGLNFLELAAAAAKRTCLPADRYVIDYLQKWFSNPRESELWRLAVTQFEQLSAPVAAKAVEDTAFYRYGRLLSRNDVGFDAKRFSDSPENFHARMLQRQRSFPHAMLTTATHDHKRGEDTRARLAVLSEYADEWADVVPRWLSQYDCTTLSAGDILMLFQTIVGAWPLDLVIEDETRRRDFANRLAQWQRKALREAKLHTDWSVPNSAYETAAGEVLEALVARNAQPDLLSQIVAFAERIAPAGAVNSLAQKLLKLTAPGVPDIYQGTEMWDFSLVDPDNRRPVSYAKRTNVPDDWGSLVKSWRDGYIKQSLITRVLEMRRRKPELFVEGSYEPIIVSGEHGSRFVAYRRCLENHVAVIVFPRTVGRLLNPNSIELDAAKLTRTNVKMMDAHLLNAFDGRAIMKSDVSLDKVFGRLPFALFVSPSIVK